MVEPFSPESRPGDATLPSDGSTTSTDRLREIYEAVVAISTDLDLPNVLQQFVCSARRLADADYAALVVLDESGTEVRDLVYDGIDPEVAAAIGRLPECQGVLGEPISSSRPLRIDDLAAHPKASGFPPGHPPMRVLLGVPITVGGQLLGNLYLADPSSGGPFTREDETAVMMLATAATATIQNARLFEASTRHRRWLEATTMIISHLLQGARSDDVLAEIAQVALQMAGADESGVRLTDPAGRSLKLAAAAGTHSPKAIGEEMPIEGTFLGAVYTTGTSSSTSDLHAIAPDDTLVTTRGVGPVLAVALRATTRVLGTLSLSRYRGGAPFDSGDLELVESFAGHAGLALAFGEAQELHERMALNDDRERIARDLHDLVIQRVFATGLTLQATASMLENGPIHDRVTHVVDELDDTIAELRTTIFALHQSNDRSSDLRLVITELVHRSADQLGFRPRLRITGEIGTRVDPNVADHLLAVLREAISDVKRHAGATRLDITIEVGEDLRLRVDDDGRGLPQDVGRPSGLRNLADRATELGGTSTLERSPLGGTRLVWTVPLGDTREVGPVDAHR